jgi:quercetin dioxygenase-like cupin family protein
MPFIILFLASWTAFWLLADLTRWREFAPASLLAMIMSLTTDTVVRAYPLWSYDDTITHLPTVAVIILDDFGIYPVVAYLFLQYFPSRQARMAGYRYFIFWTTGVILLEMLFVSQNWMTHNLWWCLPHSYIADWLIFSLLLFFYRRFQRGWPVSLPAVSSPTHTQNPSFPSYRHQNGFTVKPLAEREEIEIILVEIQPGGKVPQHLHPNPVTAMLLSGQLNMQIGDQQLSCRSGDVIKLPADLQHAVWNKSEESAVILSILYQADLFQKLEHCADEDLSLKLVQL